ncbi:hypothetical protein ACP4OV_005682 [Aristida adscensionis]
MLQLVPNNQLDVKWDVLFDNNILWCPQCCSHSSCSTGWPCCWI